MSMSGNKRVMIACVTFETYKVANPAADYKVDKIYLIHYVKDGDHNSKYYRFYERTCELLREKIPGVEIVDSEELFGPTPVYEFNTMLKVILNIINRERDKEKTNKVFVNISAGSAEYSAASAVAAMMNDDIARPFSVSTRKYTVPESRIEEVYYEEIDGKSVPVGLARETKEPRGFMTYSLHKPKEEMMNVLKIVYDNKMKGGDNDWGMKSADIIKEMKERNLWPKEQPVITDQKSKTKSKNSDSVFFYRTYIDKMKNQGWVEEIGKRYRITERGVNDIEVFTFKGMDES